MLRLEGLVPPMFALSAALVQDNAEVEARDILLQLLDVAETEPRLFRKDFASHLTMLLAIMRGRIGEGEELDMETRLAALEVVVTLVEKRPAFVRKDEPQLRAVITGMMELLLELEVTEVWHNAIEEEDLDNGARSCHQAAQPYSRNVYFVLKNSGTALSMSIRCFGCFMANRGRSCLARPRGCAVGL